MVLHPKKSGLARVYIYSASSASGPSFIPQLSPEMHLHNSIAGCLLALASTSFSTPIPALPLQSRNASCSNGPSSRSCWGNSYSTDTNWYQQVPDTGKTVRVCCYLFLFISRWLLIDDNSTTYIYKASSWHQTAYIER